MELKEQSKLKIKLSDLFANGHNPRQTAINTESIKELSENISTHGLINPLLVRPNPKKKGKYLVVAGSRRFNAVSLLRWPEVDCVVMNLSDAEAFEMAVIENLQREDVHPMDEARAFKMILEKSTIEELSKRINKPDHYIARRLKLNDLSKEAMKDFYDGHLQLAHAVQLCRLSPEDQKKCMSEILDGERGMDNKEVRFYGSPIQLKVLIEKEIFRKLNSAPFKKDDPDLYPKAGACTACPKRTGANKTLFNDVDKEDCCLDKVCYKQKTQNFVIGKIKQVRDEGHELILLRENYLSDTEAKPYLTAGNKKEFSSEYGVTIIKKEEKNSIKGIWVNGSQAGQVINVRDPKRSYGSSSASASNKKEFSSEYGVTIIKKEEKNSIKGIWVNGSQAGQVINVRDPKRSYGSSSASASSGPAAELSPQEQIARIQERIKRAVEIDRGRAYKDLKEQVLEKIPFYDVEKLNSNQPKMTELEMELFIYAIYKKGDMEFENFMDDVVTDQEIEFDNERKENNKISKTLQALTGAQYNQILRVFIRTALLPENCQNMERNQYLYNSFVDLGLHYNSQDTSAVLSKYEEIRKKREATAEKKIAELKSQITTSKKPDAGKKKSKAKK